MTLPCLSTRCHDTLWRNSSLNTVDTVAPMMASCFCGFTMSAVAAVFTVPSWLSTSFTEHFTCGTSVMNFSPSATRLPCFSSSCAFFM